MNIALAAVGKSRLFWKRHGALVMTVASGLSSGAAIILGCRASTKLEATMMKNNEEIAEAKTGNEVNKKALYMAYLHVAGRLAKLYAPTAIAYGVSVGLLVGSYSNMKKNNAALVATASGLANTLATYRQRVKDKIGEEAEEKLFRGDHKETVEVVDEKTGEVKEKSVVKPTFDPENDLCVLFAEDNRMWDKNASANFDNLMNIQAYLNRKLISTRVVFLYDVLRELQFDPEMLSDYMMKVSRNYGWIYDPTDSSRANFISFGLSDAQGNLTTEAIDAKRRNERCFWLHFNCDGDIVNSPNGEKSFMKYIRSM